MAGMPRRIPDYPDAFYIFNKISSWGSYISAFSVVIFLWTMLDALTQKNKSFLWNIAKWKGIRFWYDYSKVQILLFQFLDKLNIYI